MIYKKIYKNNVVIINLEIVQNVVILISEKINKALQFKQIYNGQITKKNQNNSK